MMYKKGLAFYSGSMKRPQGTQMLYLKARPSAAVCGGDKVGVCGVGQCGSCVLAGTSFPETQASRVGRGGLDECPPAGGRSPSSPSSSSPRPGRVCARHSQLL